MFSYCQPKYITRITDHKIWFIWIIYSTHRLLFCKAPKTVEILQVLDKFLEYSLHSNAKLRITPTEELFLLLRKGMSIVNFNNEYRNKASLELMRPN